MFQSISRFILDKHGGSIQISVFTPRIAFDQSLSPSLVGQSLIRRRGSKEYALNAACRMAAILSN